MVQEPHDAEWYAADFVRQLELDSDVEQQCEWTCLLWSKDHWANEARKGQILLQQSKEQPSDRTEDTVETLFTNSQFLNTVARVYSQLFGRRNQFCTIKKFTSCPYLGQRQDLLRSGSLAGVFVTILHKAMLYAMLDSHPIDSGLVNEEYSDVYGVDLTDFQDLEQSLGDGRFASLYTEVVKRAKQLAGLSLATRSR
ncbi:MAG TPA: hypothetical protein VLV18_02420 [Terriglobales bacterium]|nr:hypothetical protein [Terriglobales bacterium]